MLYCLDPNIIPKIRLINSAIVNPPYIHERRSIDEYVLYIVKKGRLYIFENGIKYELFEGDFFLLDMEYSHEGYKASYCEYYYIHFQHNAVKSLEFRDENQILMMLQERRNQVLSSTPYSYDEYRKDQLLLPKHFHFSNYNDFIKVNCLINEAIEHNRYQIENYKIMCSCKILESFIEISRSFIISKFEILSYDIPKSHKKVQEMLIYLNNCYREKITGDKIEELFDCNFDYINRIFKKLTQHTIFNYLNMVRVQHAKELIMESSLKTYEIALRVGFSDEYYFSKVFKKYTGMPPTVYAKGIS